MKKFYYLIVMFSGLSVLAITLTELYQGSSIGLLSLGSICLLILLAGLGTASIYLAKTSYSSSIDGFWIAAISTIVSYFILDVLIGYCFIRPTSTTKIPDHYVHHRYDPNTNAYLQAPYKTTTLRVNNLGLRGADLHVSELQQEESIIFLGDSFTMGAAINDNEVFTSILEQQLNRNASEKFKIINAGVDSYSPILSFFLLKKYLKKFKPKYIFLNLDMSDLIQEQAYHQQALYKDNKLIGISGFNNYQQQQGTRQKLIKWINNNLYFSRSLLNFILATIHPTKENNDVHTTVTLANPELLKHTLKDDNEDRTQQWDLIFNSIKMIAEEAEKRESKFILVVYPWGHQVNSKEWKHGRLLFIPPDSSVSDRSFDEIKARAKTLNIEVLDLVPAFRAYTGQDSLFFEKDMHWTAAGHRLVARNFLSYLKQQATVK